MDIEALKTAVVEFVREHQAWAPFVVARSPSANRWR